MAGITLLALLCSSSANAQFPYRESFKNASVPGFIVSGSASLTATAGIDVPGDGYLRLTDNAASQVGYAYAQDSFPYNYGLTASFEFFTHKPGATSFNQADGISFFLFDASVNAFKPGGVGGSLGYAQYYSVSGMAKGYLGISLDEFGNFSSASDGNKNGGPGQRRGSVAVRGPGNGNSSSDYVYQTGVQTDNAPFNTTFLGFTQRYPDSTQANYRRLKVILTPGSSLGPNTGFKVTVIMYKGGTPVTPVTLISNFDYPFVAPSKLKFGLAASTGSNSDIHEIRNMTIIPTNLSLLTAPIVNNDAMAMVCQDGTTAIDVTANDVSTNAGGSINKTTVDLDPLTAGKQSSFTDPGKGVFTVDAAGIVTFTPASGYTGSATASYTVNDIFGVTGNTATITATVSSGTAPELTLIDPAAVCSPLTVNITDPALKTSNTAGMSFSYFTNLTNANNNVNDINATASSVTASGTYYVRGVIGSCATVKPVNVVIDKVPTVANAGVDQSFCASSGFQSTTLIGNNPDAGIGTWSQISGPSAASINSPDAANSAVSNMQKGVYNFRWSITSGACGVSTDDMRISVGVNSNAGLNQSLCNSPIVNLQGNVPSPGIGTWTQVSGPAATITNPADPLSTVTGVSAGNSYVFAWKIVNGSCTTTSQVTITNNAAPVSNAGSNQTMCNSTTATLQANTPPAGTGVWTQTAGPAATIDQPSSASTGVSNLIPGNSYTFSWIVSNGSCAPASSAVVVNDLLNTPANAGPDQFITNATMLTLYGNTPDVNNTGMWTLTSAPPGGRATIIQPTNPLSVVSFVSKPGDYYFTWTISNGTYSNSDIMRMSVLSILPVQLLNFTAAEDNGNVTLAWQTGAEVIHDYFEVERSTDGVQFVSIGTVAKAEGNDKHQYTFPDNVTQLHAQRVYYRLKQVDTDHSFEYSRILVVDLDASNNISVWPNPFKDQVHASIHTDAPGPATLNVYDNQGKLVKRTKQNLKQGDNLITIDQLKNQADGFYILEVIKGDARYRQRLLKQK